MTEKELLSPALHRRPRRRNPLTGVAAGGVIALVVGAVVAFGALPSGSAQPAPPTSDAQAYVRAFATGLKGKVNTPLPKPVPFSYGATVDGCDHGYGSVNVCVPYNFPPQVGKTPAAKCAYLAAHKFTALEVTGKDRHGLAPAGGPKAPDGNPYACPGVLPTA